MTAKTNGLRVGPYDLSRELVLDFTKIRGLYDTIERDFTTGMTAIRKKDPPLEDLGEVSIDHFIPKPIKEKRTLTHKWTMLDESKENEKGYDGALFSVETGSQTHYIIYHRASDNLMDFAAIGRLVEGEYPKQLNEAKAFVKRAKEKIAELNPDGENPVYHVGYSLGGAMGALARDEGEPMLAIDPPPVSRVLEKQGRDKDKVGENLVTILPPHETLINSHGRHIGEAVVVGEKFWEAGQVSIQDFWHMGWANHDIITLGGFLEDMPEWKKVPAESTGRVETALEAFRVYFNDHSKGRPLAVDEKLLGWMKDHPLTRDVYEVGSKLYGRLGRLLGGKTAELDEGHAQRLLREREMPANPELGY